MPRGRPRHPDILTPREWQVLDLLCQGLTNADIAVRLSVSPETVKTHVSQVLAKLDVSSRQEAVDWAERHQRTEHRVLIGLLDWPLRNLPAGAGPRILVGSGLAVVVLVLTLLALSLFSGDQPENSLGKLAYIQDGNLWVMDLPNGKPRQLTNDGTAWYPRWSGSGEWIAEGLVTGVQTSGIGYAVNVMRADGSEKRYASGCVGWSPNDDVLLCSGGKIVWIERPDGTHSVTIDAQALIRRKRNVDLASVRCGWSPDATQIACAAHEFVSAGPSPSQYSGIWVLSSDGSDAREVFANDAFAPGGGRVILYSWYQQPDTISFTLWPPDVPECRDCPMADGLALYQVQAAGGPIGSLEAPVLVAYIYGGMHSGWREDVGAGLFTVGVGRETWTNKRIALVDRDGKLQYLTEPDSASLAPSWSADAKHLAYVAGPDIGRVPRVDDDYGGRGSVEAAEAKSQRRIWTMNVDGSDKRRLTRDNSYRDERPLWSRDGSRLLFARLDQEGRASVWLIPISGGRPSKITDVSQPKPASTLRQPYTRDAYFAEGWDYYGYVPWSFLFAWWQPPLR